MSTSFDLMVSISRRQVEDAERGQAGQSDRGNQPGLWRVWEQEADGPGQDSQRPRPRLRVPLHVREEKVLGEA